MKSVELSACISCLNSWICIVVDTRVSQCWIHTYIERLNMQVQCFPVQFCFSSILTLFYYAIFVSLFIQSTQTKFSKKAELAHFNYNLCPWIAKEETDGMVPALKLFFHLLYKQSLMNPTPYFFSSGSLVNYVYDLANVRH